MKIYSVTDKEFSQYGRLVYGFDGSELAEAMKNISMPDQGVSYYPGIDALEHIRVMDVFSNSLFGGMLVQLGMCWGYNT